MPKPAKEDEEFLRAKGWKESPDKAPWSWIDPKYPATSYLLRQAVELERSRK